MTREKKQLLISLTSSIASGSFSVRRDLELLLTSLSTAAAALHRRRRVEHAPARLYAGSRFDFGFVITAFEFGDFGENPRDFADLLLNYHR